MDNAEMLFWSKTAKEYRLRVHFFTNLLPAVFKIDIEFKLILKRCTWHEINKTTNTKLIYIQIDIEKRGEKRRKNELFCCFIEILLLRTLQVEEAFRVWALNVCKCQFPDKVEVEWHIIPAFMHTAYHLQSQGLYASC